MRTKFHDIIFYIFCFLIYLSHTNPLLYTLLYYKISSKPYFSRPIYNICLDLGYRF